MKIVIIGGGIAGCATYLSLEKYLPKPAGSDIEILIYEAYNTDIDVKPEQRAEDHTHSSTLLVGGGLGVAPNGLKVLKRLDEELLKDVVRGGYVTATSNMKNKNNWPLFSMSNACVDNDIENPRDMYTVAISRHVFWRALRARVPSRQIINKRISHVITSPHGRNSIHFADNSPSVEADLVIGADGVKSTAKRALFPESSEDPYPPHYEGLVGVGGFIPSGEVKGLVEPGSMNFIFGGNGFFGYFFSESKISDPNRESPYDVSDPGETLAWWSTYEIEECPDRQTLDMADVTRQLRERHADWKEPTVQKIMQSLRVDNMYPTWTCPPLPTWERDGVVLVGDAAHALPPTSGQGSSQALEDAEALALLLAHFTRKFSDTQSDTTTETRRKVIDSAAKSFMAIRQPRVTAILDSAQKIQNSKRKMGIIKEYSMYAFMKIMGLFPSLMTNQIRTVIEYEIAKDVAKFIANEN